jgi:xanthine dehydrogenase YagS FAD-binding subunit
MAVALRLLDAHVETVDPQGAVRSIPIAEFHRLGRYAASRNQPEARRADHRRHPARPIGGRHLYHKVRDSALCLCAGLGGGGDPARWLGPGGLWRRRAPAMAHRGGRGSHAAGAQAVTAQVFAEARPPRTTVSNWLATRTLGGVMAEGALMKFDTQRAPTPSTS